jgi:TonB family protein
MSTAIAKLSRSTAVFLFLGAMLRGQAPVSVTGLVVDASGAAVPNATVSLQVSGTDHKVFSTTTTSAGDFVLRGVPPDTYDLVVEASGFLKATTKGLKVDPDRDVSVPKIKLEVGSAGAYRIGGGVSAPTVLVKVDPEYSEEARKAKLQGTVILYVVVDERGNPRDLRVIRSLGLGLDQKAIEAVERWKFRPGKKDGKAVPVQATIEINFRL